MALIEVKAFKCEWCGRLFPTKNYHETECKYDPKARTCISCGFSGELVKDRDGKDTGVYCPRADEVFEYPHKKYCPDYITIANYEAYKK